MKELIKPVERLIAALRAGTGFGDRSGIKGVFSFKLYDASGNLINKGRFRNLVTTVGKNEILNDSLRGSTYSVTGPFCGLISSVSFSAIVAGDTMASHAGWLEANGTNAPTYGTNRPTSSFAAASGGAISFTSAASFTFTNSGTVNGAFVVTGSGALASNTSTAGTLLAAGAFATAQPVVSGNVMTVSYTLTLT